MHITEPHHLLQQVLWFFQDLNGVPNIKSAKHQECQTSKCQILRVPNRGGDLGEDWGARSPKIWGGDDAHALVPPIFREVVLSDARESTNRVKKNLDND